MLFRSDDLCFEIIGQELGLANQGEETLYLKGFEAEAEELVNGGEIDRERIDLSLVVTEDLMAVAVEVGEPANIIPNFFVGGVEDMGAVAVVSDAGFRIGSRITIAADMIALFDDEYRFHELTGDTFGDDGTQ